MDWVRTIERNSEALKAIVAALFVVLGSAAVARIPRPLHCAVLRVLRPAESALRRLIVIAARGLVVKLPPARPMPKGYIIKRGGTRHFSFQLFDPRKRFAHQRRRTGPRSIPRVHFFGPIRICRRCRRRPGRPPLPRRRPMMARSTQAASTCGFRPSRRRSRICRVRRGVSSGRGPDARRCQASGSNCR